MNTRSLERYSRQLLLPDFGTAKQELLFNARVLVIGAGGLGCPALLYLAAAGIGHLGILDFDTVEISNLHRQVLYNQHDAGRLKAEVAAEKIRNSYPDTNVTAYTTRIAPDNALKIMQDWDLVLDGSDNFPTRYLVNDACVLLGKPLIYGSVYRYEGQVAVFNYKAKGASAASTNYRDLFPTPPTANQIPNCAEAGVLGVLPGIIGNLMTNEAIKIITGTGTPLADKLVTFNSLDSSFLEFEISKNPEALTHLPLNEKHFRKRNYDLLCSPTALSSVRELDAQQFEAMAKEHGTVLLDVRQEEELPKLQGYEVLSVPLLELERRMPELAQAAKILVLCQSGIRSLKAAQAIAAAHEHIQVYSLKGGMNAWNSREQLRH